MDTLSDCLAISGKQVISLIGSGGKTSLMWYLAKCYRNEKVLVSTTTKIGYSEKQPYDYFYSHNFSYLGNDGKGITLAGELVVHGQKLSMPLSPLFQEKFGQFDKVFLEADGSKQRPLKGWETFEPVILPETTLTIGVIPISVIGKTATHETVHRLSLFLRATGIKLGDLITEEVLAEIIASPVGLWSKSHGQRILCFSQVETSEQLFQARKIVSLLPKMLLKRIAKTIAYSIQSKKGMILWENENQQFQIHW